MNKCKVKSEVKLLCHIAKTAGELLLSFFRDSIAHAPKAGRANIVTEADIAAEEIIRTELSRFFPGVAVIGEEMINKEEIKDKTYFLVDPLDGTLNFFHGIPLFTVSIAFVEASQPKLGVIHAPALNETFCASDKSGAFFNNKLLKINKSLSLEQAIAATGWPYDPKLLEWARRSLSVIQPRVQEVRIFGVASLVMCYVAAKFLDIYWEIGLAPWDVAAGWLILKEAGGCVLDINGAEFDLSSGRVLACGSEALCREIAFILREALVV